MAKLIPPPYGTTAGAFWPTTGTVPPYDPASQTYSVTEDVAGGFILETDPVGGDLQPTLQEPRVMGGVYIYIPSLAGRKLFRVRYVNENFDAVAPAVGTQARITFTEDPVGLVIGAATPFYVLQEAGLPCTVQNIGGGPATIGTENLANGQSLEMGTPFEYDATGTELAFSIINVGRH